jgi:imidazole glycerol-phosphate synthase subunit HisF
MMPAGRRSNPFEVIPSIDLIDGNVVRLQRGDFATAEIYGRPEPVLASLHIPPGARLHIVDLEGSRRGRPTALDAVERLASLGYRLQIGGGVRTIIDARQWIDCGADRLVIGTIAAEDPGMFRKIGDSIGPERIVAAIDVRGDVVRVSGWERASSRSVEDVLETLEDAGVRSILATDVARDGMLGGPSFDLYRRLASLTSIPVIASGGITTLSDVTSLVRLPNLSGTVIGRSLLDGRISFAGAVARASAEQSIPERVIPCLDVRDGRVVKGVQFENIRDAGDPVECAKRYEAEGADELVILDISATDRGRRTALETVRSVAEALFIPLTVGGGVRTVNDFRALLRAGADRVAINTAAIIRPELIAECAEEFGVQAVVLSCDAKRSGASFRATIRGGREETEVDAVAWCRHAAELGAGEILLTSVDRDGTAEGFDIELLRAVTASLTIGVIASGGAGELRHFRDAIESGGAAAVLAASLFHDRKLTLGEVKDYLEECGIPTRRMLM